MEALALFLTLLFARYGRQILAVGFLVLVVVFVRDHPYIAATVGLVLGAVALALMGSKSAGRRAPRD